MTISNTSGHRDKTNALIEYNLIRLYEYLGRQENRKIHRGKAVHWVITRPSAWPNMIYMDPGSKAEASEIRKILDSIRRMDAPPFWLAGPGSEAWTSLLENRGMVPVDLLPGMAMDIRKTSIVSGSGIPNSDLEIREVTGQKELDNWLNIVNTIIFKGKKLDRRLFQSVLGQPEIHFYLGYLKNKPVSTSMSFYSGETAGFYNIATLPDFRRMGLGRALTGHAIELSRDHGLELGILHASPMGETLYAQIGFRRYGDFKIYWMKGKEFRDY